MSAYEAHVAANETRWARQATRADWAMWSMPFLRDSISSETNGHLNPNATLGNRIYNNGKFYTLTPDDWVDEAFRNALRQEYNMSVTGGSNKMTVLCFPGLSGITQVSYITLSFKRYTARVKAAYQAKDWLKVGGNVNYAHTVTDYATEVDSNGNSSSTNTFYMVNTIAPIYPLYLRDGNGNIMTDDDRKMYDYGNGMNAGLNRPVLFSSTS